MIAERQGSITDSLPGLVALAGDQQRIARLQLCDGAADRLKAVADFVCSRCGGQDCRTDRSRISRCADYRL